MSSRLDALRRAAQPQVVGRVSAVVGLSVTVTGLPGRVGDLVRIGTGPDAVPAEVVAVSGELVNCLPLGSLSGIGAGAPVVSTGSPLRVPVGAALRGRVLDGLGRPMDGGPPLAGCTGVSIDLEPPNAMDRPRVTQPLPLGVRALDTLVPCGRGQRLGIFAGSGVGKSSLLSMITRGTAAEITVVGLIGERGREVREFLEKDLGPEGLARSVVVVATSDQPPMVRLRAAFVATRIAEWFRDQGADALLLMDSVTRVAMAQREVGLSVGEPPATRGYPPSVFALLARLLERAGTGPAGSITGLYTVLVAEQRKDAQQLRRLMAAHREVRELVEIGAYVPGTNPDADSARARWPKINEFLRQDMDDRTPVDEAWAALRRLLNEGDGNG